MLNTVLIKRGEGTPPPGYISAGELGFDTKARTLLIGVSDETGGALGFTEIGGPGFALPLVGTYKTSVGTDPATGQEVWAYMGLMRGPILMSLVNDTTEHTIQIGGEWNDNTRSWTSNGLISTTGKVSAHILSADFLKLNSCVISNNDLSIGDIGMGASGAIKFQTANSDIMQIKMRANGNLTLSTI